MLDKFTHTNSKGETLDFLSLGIFANENELRDYEWSYTTSDANRIKRFYKGVVTKTIPFVFLVDTEQAEKIKDKFYEHFDIDVVTQKKGYFTINGYNLYCYAYKSVKSSYTTSKKLLNISLEIVTDEPQWKKETLYCFNFEKGDDIDNELKYTFSYPFVYYSSINNAVLDNKSFIDSNMIIRIYGACINPILRIGNNVYSVSTTLKENEYLEIDTQNKTIFQFDNYGNATNIFNLRNKTYDCFQPITSGQNVVSASDTFKVDIITVEYRGEPKWS